MSLTSDQVLRLAPDSSSVSAANGLANERKWQNLGTDEEFLWGELQGSGSSPYQTEVELKSPAFKCTCPSRKEPCKHCLGMLLLWARNPYAFKGKERPQWVEEWVKSRETSVARKAKKVEDPEKQPDPEAKARRQAERLNKVNAGLSELERWLEDLIRAGLASVMNQPSMFWENAAARLVDAQAPGLARLVKECMYLRHEPGWEERLLKQVSKLALLVQAFRNIEALPNDLQDDVRALIGFTVSQQDVLASNSVQDNWRVLAVVSAINEELSTQRVWLLGEQTNRLALILQFAYGSSHFPKSFDSGTTVYATLSFYPGTVSFRALVNEEAANGSESVTLEKMTPFTGYKNLTEALSAYGTALSKNPWLQNFPIIVNSSRVIPAGDSKWWLADDQAMSVPAGRDLWCYFSASGGVPGTIFGEWSGYRFEPLSVLLQDGRLFAIDLLSGIVENE